MSCGNEGFLCADLALRDYAAKLGLVLKIGGINDLGKKLQKLLTLLVESRGVDGDIRLCLAVNGRDRNGIEGEISELGE